jgi:hypothetical protein
MDYTDKQKGKEKNAGDEFSWKIEFKAGHQDK